MCCFSVRARKSSGGAMKIVLQIVSATVLIAAAVAVLLAQGATAAISGNVLDPTGAAIPGATIIVKNVGTAFTRTILSDDQGRYVAAELPIGEYEVRDHSQGFRLSCAAGSR